jgi:hypothetical protein
MKTSPQYPQRIEDRKVQKLMERLLSQRVIRTKEVSTPAPNQPRSAA